MWLYSLREDPTEQRNLLSLICPCTGEGHHSSSCSRCHYINSTIKHQMYRDDDGNETEYSEIVKFCLSLTNDHSRTKILSDFQTTDHCYSSEHTDDNNVCIPSIKKQEILSRLCDTLQTLHTINSEQAKPIWPWIVEAPISIDHTPNIPEQENFNDFKE